MLLCLRSYVVIFECIFSISSYIYKTVLVVVVLMLLNDKGVKNNAMTFLCQEDIWFNFCNFTYKLFLSPQTIFQKIIINHCPGHKKSPSLQYVNENYSTLYRVHAKGNVCNFILNRECNYHMQRKYITIVMTFFRNYASNIKVMPTSLKHVKWTLSNYKIFLKIK